MRMTHPSIANVCIFRLEVRVLEYDQLLEPRVHDPVDHGEEHEQDKAEEGQGDSADKASLAHGEKTPSNLLH